MSQEKLQLADFLVALREELQEAQRKAAGENLKFAVENIDLEAQFTTSAEGNAKFGVKFWVYHAEAGGKVASQTVHKVTLSMKPVMEDGGDVLVSSRTARPE